MDALGYEEYKLGERDKERIRFRWVDGKPKFKDDRLMKSAPCYAESDDEDDYYDEDDFYESTDNHIPGGVTSSSESEDERPTKQHRTIDKKHIEKLQKLIVPTLTWSRNIYKVWLHQFTKKLRKQFDIEFDPKEDVELEDGEPTKFIRTYMHINKYIPVQTLHEEYDKLAPQIEKLLIDNKGSSGDIMELIAYCFDDANRTVTPKFFPGKDTY